MIVTIYWTRSGRYEKITVKELSLKAKGIERILYCLDEDGNDKMFHLRMLDGIKISLKG